MSNPLFVKRFVLWLALFASIFFVSMLAFFFFNLNTTTTLYSQGAFTAPYQSFYNFMHGRPFQTSLFAFAGDSIGFSHNPYAYLHYYAIHITLTPFLFAPLWSLWPNPSWLYGLVIVVNYFAMAIFAWKTLKYLSPQSSTIKTTAALGILLSSGFIYTFLCHAQLLLFGGPFILAAYYFLLTRQRAMFLLSMFLLCLVSEDAAMVAVTFAVYIYLLERDAKSYALQGGLLAITCLAIALFVIQPAARSHLVLTELNTAAKVIKLIFDLHPSMITERIMGLAPALFFLPAFGIVCLLFGKPNVSWAQVGGLILIAPLPHWGESAIAGAGHHLMPVVVFMFVSLILVLGRTPDIQPKALALSRKETALLIFLGAIFLGGCLRPLASFLPDPIRIYLFNHAGMTERAKKLEQGLAERSGNRRVIEVVGNIPKNNSLVYLTNSSLGGFIADRSDIWLFPYYYDLADYLVIQPNAHQSFFSMSTAGHLTLKEAISAGKPVDSNDAEITQETANAIVHHLVVEEKSHRVAVEKPEVILLERINKYPFYIPPSTVGFGWLR